MSSPDSVLYYAHRKLRQEDGQVYFFHASPSLRWVEIHGVPWPIVKLRIRERLATDPPSPYRGWIRADKPDHYVFVWPSELQLNICFAYGPEAEEQLGRGRKVNLIVEEIAPEGTRT